MNDYGSAISKLRKQKGLTQLELGEKLNVSYQAVSKWENNSSQPDLDTILKMSKIFGVTIDEFYKIASTEPAEDDPIEEVDSTIKMLGVCSSCGRVITEENLGSNAEKLLCKTCKQKIDAAMIQTKREQYRLESIAKAEREINESKFKSRLIWSFIVGGLSSIIFFFIGLNALPNDIFITILTAVLFFTFVPQLFWGGTIPEFVVNGFTKTFSWPGIIFSFDFDGIIFLIGMKILFWILGIVLALLCGFATIIISLIISPFTFFFALRRVLKNRSFE